MSTTAKGIQVLVVDDDAAHRRFLTRGLSLEGYRVESCDSGASGLACAEHSAPDVLLLDIMMPDIDGLAVAEAMKRAGSRVPIVFLSGSDEPELRAQVAQLGAPLLVKPVDFEELLAHLPSVAVTH
jgi:two-component system OmpR family response regulator